MIYIVFHRVSVRTIVLNCHDRSLCCDQRCLNGNAFSTDNTNIILRIHHHFIQNDGTDLTADIMDRTFAEHVVPHTDLSRIACIRIDDQHSCRCIDSTIDHVLHFFVVNLTARF